MKSPPVSGRIGEESAKNRMAGDSILISRVYSGIKLVDGRDRASSEQILVLSWNYRGYALPSMQT